VICGNAIVTYEHFNPPFKDAPGHDPQGITLLCGGHQLEASKGLLAKQSITAYDKDPLCRRVGYAKHLFDLGGTRPRLLVGGLDLTECGHKIEIDGQTFLQIAAPERRSSKWRLSCRFQNRDGTTMCEIVDNELLLSSVSVDIVQEATRFSIESDIETLLDLELQPPGALLLKKYCLLTKHGRVVIGKEKLPDTGHSMDNPGGPPKFIDMTTLRFETGSNAVSFAAS
jgi:hypothetical protein